MSSKENIQKGLRAGEYTILEKPQSNATWWKNFNRIKNKDNKTMNSVQCVPHKKWYLLV